MQEKYRVLIIGSGGREHAFTWKISLSNKVDKIFVAPGNAGTADEPKTENVDLSAEDLEGLLAFAKNKEIDITIVGPEAPLVLGLIDLFEKNNLLCLGPNKLAAQMEGSKIFMKDVLKRGNIPTATYEVFTNPESAREFLETCDIPASPSALRTMGMSHVSKNSLADSGFVNTSYVAVGIFPLFKTSFMKIFEPSI
jgi:phosphoribosylamine--glycine ligase